MLVNWLKNVECGGKSCVVGVIFWGGYWVCMWVVFS